MGGGIDGFGAHELTALGLASVVDARGVAAVRPPGRRDPTVLRLRTARRDWYLETQTHARTGTLKRRQRLPRGVIASYVDPFRDLGERSILPSPYRYPRTAGRACRTGIYFGRFVYRPGNRLVVPGVFRVRVLGGHPLRVRTTWHDRTPPALTVDDAAVERPFGAGAELAVSLRAGARGAGVLAAEVDQGGAITRVAADALPGLAIGRRAKLRVPFAGGAGGAAVRVLDAAGNATPWAQLDVSRSRLAARVEFDPPLGRDPISATRLAPSQPVVLRGATDPGFAGLTVDVDIIGRPSGEVLLSVAPDGTFGMTWVPPLREQYRLILRIPVERIPGSVNLRYQELDGFVRR